MTVENRPNVPLIIYFWWQQSTNLSSSRVQPFHDSLPLIKLKIYLKNWKMPFVNNNFLIKWSYGFHRIWDVVKNEHITQTEFTEQKLGQCSILDGQKDKDVQPNILNIMPGVLEISQWHYVWREFASDLLPKKFQGSLHQFSTALNWLAGLYIPVYDQGHKYWCNKLTFVHLLRVLRSEQQHHFHLHNTYKVDTSKQSYTNYF